MNDTTQNKSHPATTIEFFREKSADEDNEEGTEPVWIDSKDDSYPFLGTEGGE